MRFPEVEQPSWDYEGEIDLLRIADQVDRASVLHDFFEFLYQPGLPTPRLLVT